MVSKQKKSQVDSLSNIFKNDKNFAIVKIDKTTHQNLESLRKELRKSKSSIKVIKNALFEKALNRSPSGKPLLKEMKKKFFPLKETSALVDFNKDWSTGLKSFYEFIQKEKTLSFKFSLLDKVLYNGDETIKIAKLPSKDELVAKLIGSLKSPMAKFIYSLKFNTNKFVYILQSKSKGGDK